MSAGEASGGDGEVALVVHVHKDRTGGARNPCTPDLQLGEGEPQVVPGVEIVGTP